MWDQRTKDLLKALLEGEGTLPLPHPEPGTSVTLTMVRVTVQTPAKSAPERPAQ
jgi:hypothetical protein